MLNAVVCSKLYNAKKNFLITKFTYSPQIAECGGVGYGCFGPVSHRADGTEIVVRQRWWSHEAVEEEPGLQTRQAQVHVMFKLVDRLHCKSTDTLRGSYKFCLLRDPWLLGLMHADASAILPKRRKGISQQRCYKTF